MKVKDVYTTYDKSVECVETDTDTYYVTYEWGYGETNPDITISKVISEKIQQDLSPDEDEFKELLKEKAEWTISDVLEAADKAWNNA